MSLFGQISKPKAALHFSTFVCRSVYSSVFGAWIRLTAVKYIFKCSVFFFWKACILQFKYACHTVWSDTQKLERSSCINQAGLCLHPLLLEFSVMVAAWFEWNTGSLRCVRMWCSLCVVFKLITATVLRLLQLKALDAKFIKFSLSF